MNDPLLSDGTGEEDERILQGALLEPGQCWSKSSERSAKADYASGNSQKKSCPGPRCSSMIVQNPAEAILSAIAILRQLVR
jgi:hypothetical protein